MRKLRLTDIISMILVVTLLVGVISFSMLAQLDDFVARAEADASVTLASVEEGPFYFGDTVQLFVTVTGMNGSYRLEWQYNDGEHGWQPLGFSGSTYTYVVDESNVDLLYRVVAYTADEPVAEEPVVDEPVAEEPAAEEPVAEEPTAEEPAAEEPAAEEPVAEESPAEEPAADEPVAEELPAEEPVAEEPAADEPVAEELPAEEPVAEEPVAEELPAEAPVTEEPAEEAPAEDETAAE